MSYHVLICHKYVEILEKQASFPSPDELQMLIHFAQAMKNLLLQIALKNSMM